MKLIEAFNEIQVKSHFWNWSPDWTLAEEIYSKFPNSYSLLTPFAYSYLEELIRSTTSEYGRELFDENGNIKTKRCVGISLINLAIKENEDNIDLVKTLNDMKFYFYQSKPTDIGDNRNSVVHGYMHPRFWDVESFEQLIFDIAKLSKYSGF